MNRNVEDVARDDPAAVAEGVLARAVLDALPSQIAVLNDSGNILAVNEAWRRFADENGGSPVGVGASYFDACRRAEGADVAEAQAALTGIQAVLDCSTSRFTLEYPCHAPGLERWFLLSVVPLYDHRGDSIVVSHLNITERRKSEQELREGEIKVSPADGTRLGRHSHIRSGRQLPRREL